MIFLKKFKAIGFKSYADQVELDFTQSMTGIVGPNGSGKSNIVDAIKWVLGEQSMKSLRGTSGEDVIFHGSKSKEPAKFAEVTLLFDNSNDHLHHASKTIEVKRKVERGVSGNEYFINGQPARLKDIQEIFLDTGLSKGSLGIIGQGTVQWFAEAKPEDRRKIFEEAAGIGLYTKKKQESVRQLEKSEENLSRVNDIVNELSRDLKKLQKQAEKAKVYLEKKKQLTDIEVTLLVNDVTYYKHQIENQKAKSEGVTEYLHNLSSSDQEIVQRLQNVKEKSYECEKIIDEIGNKLHTLNEEITKVENQKNFLDSQLSSDLNSNDLKVRSQALKSQITNLITELDDRKQRYESNKSEIAVYTSAKRDLDSKIDLAKTQNNQKLNEVQMLRNKRRMIDDQIQNSSNLFEGVRVILAHKQSLSGIHDIISNIINVEEKYSKAVEYALGNSIQNVVVEVDQDADNAIKFLKQNQAGTATFIPLNTIKAKKISEDSLIVLRQTSGFVGIASEIIKYAEKFAPAIRSLLGSTIVANNVNDALYISRLTYQNYRVVTLDGDVVQAGGSVTGGYKKEKISSLNLQGALEEITKQINDSDLAMTKQKVQIESLLLESNEVNSKLTEKLMTSAKLEEYISNSSNRVVLMKLDYEKLTNTSYDGTNTTASEVIERLNTLVFRKDKLLEELKATRENKILYTSQMKDLDSKFIETRNKLDQARNENSEFSNNLFRMNSIVDSSLRRLSEIYKMTFEYARDNFSKELPVSEEQAREIVSNLRRDIDNLGAINMEAIEEYQQKNLRYEELYNQKKELEEAKAEIEKAIKELDEIALRSFDGVIKSINQQLPQTFKYLFGGGSCVVEYSNPDNILESGIEVLANPPGKNVNSLNLLSGGEKTLVALSVLFAILQIKSLPMIILDEAESALDPSNVEKFAEIVSQNSKKTQFVVITHRPGTMERCDVLFGAVMQNKGITKMLSVTLSQAERFSDQTNILE
jgi:chromosome segregation protein